MNKTKLAAFVLAVAAIPLSIDATLLHLPGIPDKLAMAWPTILAIASVLHKWASNFQGKTK